MKEIHTKANVLFYMYSTDQFMERAEAFLGLGDHGRAIEEIRDIIEQDEAKSTGTFDQLVNIIGMIHDDEKVSVSLKSFGYVYEITDMWRRLE